MANPLTPPAPARQASLWALLACIMLLRAWLAFAMPLSFDETYYWLWSNHLAAGYYDHPPMVALMIRLSTLLFGDGALGVRALAVLLAIPTSWAVWFAASQLLNDRTASLRAVVYFNLMLMVSVALMIATPDAPLLCSSAVTLALLAKLTRSNQGRWWLWLGVCLGLGLVSKYTTLFLGFSVLLWVLLVPAQRRWLVTPWPYMGAAIALALFAPVVAWNATHGYVSFIKQFGRAQVHSLSFAYVADYGLTQLALITPPLLILAIAGIARCLRPGPEHTLRMMLVAFTLPLTLYFAWHSLHARVGGNWLLPIYPALAIAAAWSSTRITTSRMLNWSRQAAIPLGMTMLIVSSLFLPLPTSWLPGLRSYLDRQLGYGWDTVAAEIDQLQTRTGAHAIVTTNYATTGLLSYYLKPGSTVVEIIEPQRWLGFDRADPASLSPPLLYVTEPKRSMVDDFPLPHMRLSKLATFPRMAHGREVAQIEVYLVSPALGAKKSRP